MLKILLISVCNDNDPDSPQTAHQFSELQQTRVDGQPDLTLRHGQLTVFKRVVCDGDLQGPSDTTHDNQTRTLILTYSRNIRLWLEPVSGKLLLKGMRYNIALLSKKVTNYVT